jgi:hypothetical protein
VVDQNEPCAVSWTAKFFLAGHTEDSIYWTTNDTMSSQVLALNKSTHKFSASLFPERLPYWPVEPNLNKTGNFASFY